MVDLGVASLVIAAILVAIHFAAIRRITDFGGDGAARWRYRDDPLGDEIRVASRPARSDTQAARATGRLLILIALMAPVIFLALWVAAPPDWPQPMSYEPPWYEGALVWIGAGGYLVGLGWMVRIYRADPEPDQRGWRYRS